MRKLFVILAIAVVTIATLGSCGGTDTWEEYETWRTANIEWYNTQLSRTNPDGSSYFKTVQPDWYPQSGVLIHYFNDRSLTANNLQPLITSQVEVRYKGRLYNDECFDSTTVGSDSTRTFLLSGTVLGWQLALTQMHVGDSAEIIIPYTLGYDYMGSTNSMGGYSVPPYSTLRFNVRLVDIPAYEIP